MELKIILNSDNSTIIPALRALERSLPKRGTGLYCLCANKSELNDVKNECENLKKNNRINYFKIFTHHDFNDPPSMANHLLDELSSGYLLFLSSNILLEENCLQNMLDRIASDDLIAGANPFLKADWTSNSDERAAFMGLTFDYQKKLHFLYEGILINNELATKERFFQMAHPACLLIRGEDFKKAGGFKIDLGFLTFPALCFQILIFRPKGYICVNEAQGRQLYKFDSWDLCGAWDSILQRGRLETNNINSDYADFCSADGIEYGCDSWLSEGPLHIPDLSNAPSVRDWQEWRYHPKPASLLPYLSSLPPEERYLGLDLLRNRPAFLPQTLQYYKVQANKIKSLVEESNLPIHKQIELWLSKIRRFHYGELKPGIELLKKAGIYNCSLDVCPAIFDAWVEVGEKFEHLEISESWPEIAVLMPVWNPKANFLSQAIESVMEQTYPNWQLCIADDASTKSEIRPLLESYKNRDERIKIKFREKNGHICRASNSALEMVTAPFTAFLDHDDLLSPHALAEVAGLIAKRPDLGFIYTDDDRINEDNVRRSPVFRPDFDCDLSFTGHLSTYDTKLIREIGGLRIGTEGSQDTDLRFRVTELLDHKRIAHIPRILYHWRVHEESTASSLLAKPYVLESRRKVYLDAAARQGRHAEWGGKAAHRLFNLLHYPGKRYHCSVIFLIDKKGPSKTLLETVRDLEKYLNLEIYAQPLNKTSPQVKSCLSLPYAGADFSSACNEAAATVNGDVLLFLSANLEPEYECRLEQLVELAMTPHIAMASANIWHDGKLACGGCYPNADGLAFPLLQGMDRNQVKNSVWGQMFLPRHVLGASWYCMAVKKEPCQGGKFLDERYRSFATVDFALRAMKQNKFVAITPWVNWQSDIVPAPPTEIERQFLMDQKGAEIASCGLRNPNLRAAPDKDWTLIL